MVSSFRFCDEFLMRDRPSSNAENQYSVSAPLLPDHWPSASSHQLTRWGELLSIASDAERSRQALQRAISLGGKHFFFVCVLG